MSDNGDWRLNTEAEESGRIVKVTFSVDIPEGVDDVRQAMKRLAAIALWWNHTLPIHAEKP